MALIDGHGRVIDYIRIAVTDKCNLRCYYCMPEKGISFVKKEALMTYEEMLRLTTILAKQGVSKVRITGGEPFLRKDIMYFLRELSSIQGINKIAITTNGTRTLKYLDELQSLGIRSFNLSIDSIDPIRFEEITRRAVFEQVWACLTEMSKRDVDLKLNAVVIKDKNIEDILPMVLLGKERKITIRFIEEMPFNGTGSHYQKLEWDHHKILNHISNVFGPIEKLEDPVNSTSLNYKIEGFVGSFGIIPAYSRTFCGSCNRIRLTPNGVFKTCLYDEGVFNLKDIMRAGATDEQLLKTILNAVEHKFEDGIEAERNRSLSPNVNESMSTIGG